MSWTLKRRSVFINGKDRKRPPWQGKQVKKQKLERALNVREWPEGREGGTEGGESRDSMCVCWGHWALTPG